MRKHRLQVVTDDHDHHEVLNEMTIIVNDDDQGKGMFWNARFFPHDFIHLRNVNEQPEVFITT